MEGPNNTHSNMTSDIYPSHFPLQCYVNFSPLHARYTPSPSHPPCIGYPNNTWRQVQIMKLNCINKCS